MPKKREKQSQLKILLEAVPAAITLYDENDILIDCNTETVKLFGFTDKATFIKEFNQRFFDFSAEYQPCGTPTKVKIGEVFGQTRLQGRIQVEWLHLNVEGKEIPINATLTMVEIEDKPMILVCDADLREIRIAKAKKVEAERRLLESEITAIDREKKFKDAMLATLSHEIRTPLAVMSANAEMIVKKIRGGGVNERVLKALDTISDESHRLADLATSIMDMFAKNAAIEAGTSIDIGSMVSQLAGMLTSTAKRQKVAIVLKLPESLPHICGVSAELMRVLWNIFENALRYTKKGKITAIGGVQVKNDTRYVSITIEDTGYGMTPEIKARAFERGYSTEEMTGLGLAFCKEIIEAHDGEISIKSEPGKGCAVTFILPEYSDREDAHGRR